MEFMRDGDEGFRAPTLPRKIAEMQVPLRQVVRVALGIQIGHTLVPESVFWEGLETCHSTSWAVRAARVFSSSTKTYVRYYDHLNLEGHH